MSPQYGELRPTSGWDRSGSLWHPSKFQRVSRLGSVTTATSLNGSQPNFALCLAISWSGTLHIHFRGFLPSYGILPGAKVALHPRSLALSYFGSVTARHLSSGHEPNFVALSTGRHLYLAGRPSRWALAHILVCAVLVVYVHISTRKLSLISLQQTRHWPGIHFHCQVPSDRTASLSRPQSVFKNTYTHSPV